MIEDGVTSLLLDTNLNISSFGEDESGEIYVVHIGGTVSRIAGTPSTGVTQRRYFIPNRGGVFLPANGVENSSPSTGYTRITADPNDGPPNGLEIVSLRQNGVRISETTFPATPLVQSGRIFAHFSGQVTTGLAIANPNAFPVNVDFHFTNPAGQDFGHGTTTIPENGQLSASLNQAPFNLGSALNGTLTFRASGLVAATGIRGVINDRSEFLISALPVVPINATVLNGTLFPFWAHGQGWKSEFGLVNPSDVLVSGVINLVGPAGQTLDSPSLLHSSAVFDASLSSNEPDSPVRVRSDDCNGRPTPVWCRSRELLHGCRRGDRDGDPRDRVRFRVPRICGSFERGEHGPFRGEYFRRRRDCYSRITKPGWDLAG